MSARKTHTEREKTAFLKVRTEKLIVCSKPSLIWGMVYIFRKLQPRRTSKCNLIVKRLQFQIFTNPSRKYFFDKNMSLSLSSSSARPQDLLWPVPSPRRRRFLDPRNWGKNKLKREILGGEEHSTPKIITEAKNPAKEYNCTCECCEKTTAAYRLNACKKYWDPETTTNEKKK